MDLSPYTGIGQFGPAYEAMLRGDSHAVGSVDRVLVERMVRVCAETADHLYGGFTPTVAVYEQGSRPELERAAAQATGGTSDTEEQVSGIARFCRDQGRDAEQDLDAMRVGGTEEEIIARGSDWCTDVARVACALCQVVGIPARLVCLADTGTAYSGHVIVEAFRGNAWGAVSTGCSRGLEASQREEESREHQAATASPMARQASASARANSSAVVKSSGRDEQFRSYVVPAVRSTDLSSSSSARATCTLVHVSAGSRMAPLTSSRLK